MRANGEFKANFDTAVLDLSTHITQVGKKRSKLQRERSERGRKILQGNTEML